ncbi:MAG TPA: hypothetical protein VGU61_11835 [Noviherbaspirillum sp.]|jgi:hypothetical protein|uniref:hypothetical protein n=1 Tax=Noviherbaspirillum sp. TaxID=1926288 RepID=UPI002DDD9971|nr:hypothetical protein [Noviherbaspirillum sp.]HEV2610949.1 hypothetical protein [Noviherbaspirillum sp.]
MLESNVYTARLSGADAISSIAAAIAQAKGITLARCEWDIGEDLTHEHAHRMDIFTDTKTVRLYFPDLALTAPDQPARRKRIEDKLSSAIAQLALRPPVATYSFN